MKYRLKTLKPALAAACITALGLAGAGAQDAAADAKLNQALGFAPRLHADTEMVLGLRNLEDFANGIGKSNTWKKVTALMMQEAGMDLSDAEMPYQQIMSFIGKDAFIAFGKGSGDELERLMEVAGIYNKFTYQMAAEGALANMDIGDRDQPDPEKMMKELFADPTLMNTLETMQLPSIILGCRPANGQAKQVLAQLEALEGELPPIVVASEFEVAGAGTFRSWAVAAKDAFADEYRNKMREEVGDAELAAKFEKIIDTKKVELSFGAAGDHILIGIGASHAHMKLAAGGAESLASHPDFNFISGYAGKKLLAYSYASKGILSSLVNPEQWDSLTNAGTYFLKELVKGGIDVNKAVPLIEKLGGQMKKLYDYDVDSSASVIYVENGLKGASIGGYSMRGIDTETPIKLAGAAPKDALLTINGVSTPEAGVESTEMLETVGAAAYHIASGIAKAQGGGDFAEQFGMMDQMFKPKLLKIWTIMRDKLGAGLGTEGGLVIDLKGKMPKIPNVPRVLVAQGKLPRIAMFNSVKNRAMLTEAWTELVPAINDLAKSIPGQQPGAEFQLPDTLSSDGKDVKTHFIPIPFTGADLLPSISLSDELFFMSTSKNFSEELAAGIAAGGGAKQTGMLVDLRISALHDYAEGWLDLVLANSKEVFGGNEFAEEDFKENAGNIRMVLGLFDGMKGVRYHKYKDARWRTDWHFEVADIK